MAFFCGSRSLSHVDDGPWSPSPPRSPRRKCKRAAGNPYSDRGLDKFSTLLAELEARRERIVAAAGAQGVSAIHFVFSSSGDWVPVVVRTQGEPRKGKWQGRAEEQGGAEEPRPAPPEPKRSSTSEAGGRTGASRWRPSQYLAAAAVLILLCMAASGRAFAICCATMWWYAVPAMRGHGHGHGHGWRKTDRGLGASGLDGLASPRRPQLGSAGTRGSW